MYLRLDHVASAAGSYWRIVHSDDGQGCIVLSASLIMQPRSHRWRARDWDAVSMFFGVGKQPSVTVPNSFLHSS